MIEREQVRHGEEIDYIYDKIHLRNKLNNL